MAAPSAAVIAIPPRGLLHIRVPGGWERIGRGTLRPRIRELGLSEIPRYSHQRVGEFPPLRSCAPRFRTAWRCV